MPENKAAPQEPTYRGSNGTETPVSKLADTYLVNIVRKMEKATPGVVEIKDQFPIYPILKAELANRCEKTRAWYDERVREGK